MAAAPCRVVQLDRNHHSRSCITDDRSRQLRRHNAVAFTDIHNWLGTHIQHASNDCALLIPEILAIIQQRFLANLDVSCSPTNLHGKS